LPVPKQEIILATGDWYGIWGPTTSTGDVNYAFENNVVTPSTSQYVYAQVPLHVLSGHVPDDLFTISLKFYCDGWAGSKGATREATLQVYDPDDENWVNMVPTNEEFSTGWNNTTGGDATAAHNAVTASLYGFVSLKARWSVSDPGANKEVSMGIRAREYDQPDPPFGYGPYTSKLYVYWQE